VADHDFIPSDASRAYPYGIYDLKANTVFVNVVYPQAAYMLILAVTAEVLTVREGSNGNMSCIGIE
jgi:hypothetical protein